MRKSKKNPSILAPSNTAQEPAYKPVTAIITVIIAALSISLNAYLGVTNRRITSEKASVEIENIRLNSAIEKRRASPDIEARYYVITGMGLFDIGNADPEEGVAKPVVQNNIVWKGIREWLSNITDGSDLIVERDGVTMAHGVVLLSVTNNGTEIAKRVTLTLGSHSFTANQTRDLWELDPTNWPMSTVKLADIKPKQSVIIPLAHVIGTNTYIGKVLLPMQLQWENPLLSSMDKLKIEKMVPADQWMMMGLNKAVAQ